MSERSRQTRPQLQHRASQTLTIDLTDDTEDPPIIIRPRARNIGGMSRTRPQLGRSDAQALNVIDLTDDNDAALDEPEVEVMSSRQLPRPVPAPRSRSPGLFVSPAPQESNRLRGIFDRLPNLPRLSLFGPGGPETRNVQASQAGRDDEIFHYHGNNQGVLAGFAAAMVFEHEFALLGGQQMMPGQLDYQHQAFANRKPDHIAPEAAKAGFTRSPTESDTIICPSCEEELVHYKDEEAQPIVKKGGKTPSKKEREEHPFWVVRECGHVYCNRCYQYRVPNRNNPFKASFKEIPPKSGRKQARIGCAVEDCESDVQTKDRWVGVFL
ncbi:hypothetical protein B0O99DRAFT_682358 [Bisporella sp. PMI_857]|nr:hypothetical protein B0O99DRAFT_682358 [Bisporella sp. PMI_857]